MADSKEETPSVTISITEALAAVHAAQTAHGLEIAAKLDELRETITKREVLYPSGTPRTLEDLINVARITGDNLRAVADTTK